MQNASNATQLRDDHPSPRWKPLPGFEVSVTSGDLAAREALQKVMKALDPLALDPEEASTVELVLAEALNNIVEHAYPDPQTAGPIHIKCRHHADGLHFRVHDIGLAMPDGRAPVGGNISHDVPIDDLPEGGFGWFLIQDLAKDVQYDRVGEENQLNLRIAVAYGRSH